MSLLIDSMPDFSNKAVTFYLANVPLEYAVTLESPSLEVQAGRVFAVGNAVPSASHDWASGVRVSVAWDQVSQYLVFDTAEEYSKKVGSNPGGFLGLFGRR